MKPSERIKHIKAIASELSKEEWSLIDLTLKQFKLPWAEQWNSNDKDSYIIDMVSDANDDSLLELAKHLGTASELESVTTPDFWESGDPRVFISHLATVKEKTAELGMQLRFLGISTFIAHNDIEPTREWQDEIELALSTMDAMIALMSPGFRESNWCDQEVGVAIGRKVPIVPVRVRQDPYGFIGKYQAIQGEGKTPTDLASEIFNILIDKSMIGPKITSKLIRKLIDSNTWDESKRTMELIEKSKYISKNHIEDMQNALDENRQVAEAWGVPEKIKAMADKISS